MLVPILAIVIVVAGILMLSERPAPPSGDLRIKYSTVRSGLRLDLDQAAIPLRLGQWYSVAANLPQEQFAYVFTIDPVGHVVGETFSDQDGLPRKLQRIQVPGADVMLPLSDPPGARTVILLAGSAPIDDVNQIALRLRSLRNLPKVPKSEMLVLRGGRIETLRNISLPPDPDQVEADLGFLPQLVDMFGSRFEIVEAVVFPVAGDERRDGMTLYDLGNP